MQPIAIILLFTLAVLVALFVGRPLLERRRRAGLTAEEHQLSSLLAERDRVITALQELDFDRALDKVPAEDYSGQRADLLRYGADVLRKIDEFAPRPGRNGEEAQAESRIEAAIAARRADAAESPRTEASDEALEELITSRRSARKDKSAGFCPNCGRAILRSDRFCPSCGKLLQ